MPLCVIHHRIFLAATHTHKPGSRGLVSTVKLLLMSDKKNKKSFNLTRPSALLLAFTSLSWSWRPWRWHHPCSGPTRGSSYSLATLITSVITLVSLQRHTKTNPHKILIITNGFVLKTETASQRLGFAEYIIYLMKLEKSLLRDDPWFLFLLLHFNSMFNQFSNISKPLPFALLIYCLYKRLVYTFSSPEVQFHLPQESFTVSKCWVNLIHKKE